MRRTAVARSERSISERLPLRSSRPRSMIPTLVHSSRELGEDVAADQDRLAHPAQLAQDLAHLDPRARIQARGRLVQDEQLRVVDQRVRQAQPLAHPARERLDVRVALVDEAHDLQQLPDHGAAPRRRHVVAAREEVEVLPDPQVVVDAVEVGHVADPAAHLDGVLGDGDPAHQRLPGGRGEQGGQDAHGGRLARAVGADEAVDLARADEEVDAGQRQLVVVALGEAARLDHRGRHRRLPSTFAET